MKSNILARSLVVILLAGGAIAHAQAPSPSAPSAGSASAYVGPSTVPAMTAKQLLETAADNQYFRLQGRLISNDGGKKYTFADDTGRLPVEISSKHFPVGATITAEQRVEVTGKVDKGLRRTEFEVKQVRLLP